MGGADDSALPEYIILMLVNGKTQDQIASGCPATYSTWDPMIPERSTFSLVIRAGGGSQQADQ
jgi:hypothetical protein